MVHMYNGSDNTIESITNGILSSGVKNTTSAFKEYWGQAWADYLLWQLAQIAGIAFAYNMRQQCLHMYTLTPNN